MAFQPTACSKYVPRSRSTVPRLPTGPFVIDDPNSLRAAVPDEVRQFPPRRGSAAAAANTFNNAGAASQGAKLTGQSPRPTRGMSGAPSPSMPESYESRDWRSVTKAEFPGRVAEVVPKAVQDERRRMQQTSAVPVGLCKAPFPQSTHSRDFFPSFGKVDPRATRAETMVIDRSHSDVKTAGDKATPGQYTTMAHTQFQRLPYGKADDTHAKHLKANSNSTHWTFGSDRPDYAPVSAKPLPSTAPLVKNRPPSAGVPRDRNMFVAKDAHDARPPRMTAEQVAASKNTSTVPLMGNHVEGSAVGSIIPRTLTASAQATPAYVAVRREAINPVADEAAKRPASGKRAPLSSPGLQLGNDSVEYQSMARAQFPGSYFGRR